MRIPFYFILTIGLVRTESLSYIIKSIKMETSYRTIILLRSCDTCWDETQFHDMVPVISFDGNQSTYLKQNFNSKVLALVCLYDNDNNMLGTLYSSLQEMRDTTTILFALSDEQIRRTFLKCFNQKMLNVLAFKGADRNTIYSYRAFPSFQIIRRNVTKIERYFKSQLKDLGGHIVKVLPDNTMPRTVAYRDANGNRKLAGYLFDFIKNYISTINATLQVVWDLVPEEGMIALPDLWRLSEKSEIDVPLGIFGLEIVTPRPFVPLQISSWYLMLPMEPAMPRAEFFLNIGLKGMIPIAIVLAIVLSKAHQLERSSNENWPIFRIGSEVLRGVLAQTFILPRCLSPRLLFLYWLLLMSGFFMNNYCTANVATWLVHPPKRQLIQNWEEMRHLKVKTLVVETELEYLKRILGKDVVDSHKDVFVVTDSADFQKKRMEMDPTYAYPVTGTLWPSLKDSQHRLKDPIFRQSKEFNFIPFLVLVIPVPPNSLFKKSLERYIGLTHQSGLFWMWFNRSFRVLNNLGKMSCKTDRQSQEFHKLVWKDFSFIWLGYMGGSAFSLTIFFLELGYHKWHAKKRNLRR
ncbi:hypothetical protein KR074_002820 [Drosophila pseudoananassae]|nr:hypothetical protein KR074_002820 [Drosophila pseudoananassae]